LTGETGLPTSSLRFKHRDYSTSFFNLQEFFHFCLPKIRIFLLNQTVLFDTPLCHAPFLFYGIKSPFVKPSAKVRAQEQK